MVSYKALNTYTVFRQGKDNSDLWNSTICKDGIYSCDVNYAQMYFSS